MLGFHTQINLAWKLGTVISLNVS
uniref:Uncharacterized protein n=1 Tax=Arundo donax TaxID=35708 RepID=A0A0A9AEJ3_ARUDO